MGRKETFKNGKNIGLFTMVKKLDDIVGKYVGYSLEACGFCGIVYGICTGDNYTALSSGFAAYVGTIVHRSFEHLQKQSKGKAIKD